MASVICQRCRKLIDKEKEEFIKKSTGYVHKSCEEKDIIKRNTVTCQICRGDINKLTDEYEKKSTGYVHKKCIPPEDLDRLELYNYITQIFHFKAPGPVNLRLIKDFHDNKKYSYKSMYYALKYFVEVQHNSVDKMNGRIGIIPYIYDEAKEYYENLVKTQNKILVNVGKQLEKEENAVVIKSAPHRKKKIIDLEGLD